MRMRVMTMVQNTIQTHRMTAVVIMIPTILRLSQRIANINHLLIQALCQVTISIVTTRYR